MDKAPHWPSTMAQPPTPPLPSIVKDMKTGNLINSLSQTLELNSSISPPELIRANGRGILEESKRQNSKRQPAATPTVCVKVLSHTVTHCNPTSIHPLTSSWPEEEAECLLQDPAKLGTPQLGPQPAASSRRTHEGSHCRGAAPLRAFSQAWPISHPSFSSDHSFTY